MDKTDSTPRARYFEELTSFLKREGFEPQPPVEASLPIHYSGKMLCSATENGIRYFPANVNSTEKEEARDRVEDAIEKVKEYMKLMEAAPILQASGLDEQYKLLADFNGGDDDLRNTAVPPKDVYVPFNPLVRLLIRECLHKRVGAVF